MTTHMLGTAPVQGIGDDGRVHKWRWTMGEPMVRVCDGIESTNVELYARDKHGDRDACAVCKEKRR